jgi:hypothetical protein
MANIIQTTHDSVPDEQVDELPCEFIEQHYGVQEDGSSNLPPVPANSKYIEFEKYENEEITIGEKVCSARNCFFVFSRCMLLFGFTRFSILFRFVLGDLIDVSPFKIVYFFR